MNTVIKLAVYALRLLYLPYKLFLRPKNKITMLTRQGNEAPISYVLTKNALQKIDPDLEIVILAKKLEGNIINKLGYCFHVLEQMYHIATSKIVIVDGYCIPVSVLTHKKEQKFVQMWHALNIIKKFGYLAIDKPNGAESRLAETMCMHKNYTHILSGSRETGELLKKSFHSEHAEIVLLGLPYIDHIMNENEDIVRAMLEKYPHIKEKETILYAPTFRRNRRIDVQWIQEKFDLDKYNVVIKLHPIDQKGINGNYDPRIIFDEDFRTYEWLWLCDSVITDYSGISVEASLLNRKLYFYLYDKELYEEEVGLNVDLYEEPLKKYVCESADQLVAMLEENYDFALLEEYRNQYVEFDTKDCSGQFAKWLIQQLDS